MNLSIKTIVIFIIALVILGLIIGFVVPKFKTTYSQFVVEQKEPSPPVPNMINQLTISRELVKTASLQPIIKASLYNPSVEDWNIVEHWGVLFKGCAEFDSVCFINTSNELCDEFSKDVDCLSAPTNVPGDGCLVVDGSDGDPDCAPSEIKLLVYCGDELVGESYVQDIPSNDFKTFTLLLNIPPIFEKKVFHQCFMKSVSSEPVEKEFSLYLEK